MSEQALTDLVVAIRDQSQTLVTVCEGILRVLEPEGSQGTKEKKSYDIEKIGWVSKQGDKGPFEQSDDVSNINHKELLKDLSAHKGKMTIGQYFVWIFQNGSTIGRKKRSF